MSCTAMANDPTGIHHFYRIHYEIGPMRTHKIHIPSECTLDYLVWTSRLDNKDLNIEPTTNNRHQPRFSHHYVNHRDKSVIHQDKYVHMITIIEEIQTQQVYVSLFTTIIVGNKPFQIIDFTIKTISLRLHKFK